jgi:acyl carrier protein
MREKLIALIQNELGDIEVTEKSTFVELGMDSLDYVLLIQEIRSEIGGISDEAARKALTVGDLLDHISIRAMV